MAQDVALVTGASSGIGAALARRIAREGRNVALVARRRDRLEALGREIERDAKVAAHAIACDLTAPSPFAAEALTARPYAYLDDAPLEERRTQAVMARRYTDPSDTTDLARLDPEAIDAVREQAWPQVRNADEMH